MDEWYFSDHGRPAGPISFSYLARLVSLQPDLLVWRHGLGAWVAAHDLPEFAEIVRLAPPPLRLAPPPLPSQVIAGPQAVYLQTEILPAATAVAATHPWRRFFARLLDYYILFAVVLVWAFSRSGPVTQLSSLFAVQGRFLIISMMYIPVEMLLLLVFKRSFGKMLYGIRLTNISGKAFKRSLLVWFRGMGTGFPMVAPFANGFAYRHLKANGITSWDRDLGIEVVHRRLPFWRWAIILIVWVIALVPVMAIILGILDAIRD